MSIQWAKGGDYFLSGDGGAFLINRTATRDTVTYTAVRGGKGGAEDILHVERGLAADDDPGRLAALDRCKAACEAARV
jgi:hypothetical protein